MTFEIRQKVVIRKNLGRKNYLAKNDYFYNGNIGDVPLGSEGVIAGIDNEERLRIKLKNGQEWYVHPDELATGEELAQAEAEHGKKIDSLLEATLLASEPATDISEEPQAREQVEQVLIREESPAKVEIPEKAAPKSFFYRIKDRISGFFGYKPKQEVIEERKIEPKPAESVVKPYKIEEPKRATESVQNNGSERKFKPRFNAREEFVAWIDKEFPELEIYTGNTAAYEALEKRKEEVYEAARQACLHGLETTLGCARGPFYILLPHLTADRDDHLKNLAELVRWIKHLSPNLKTSGKDYGRGTKHYGIYLKEGRYYNGD